MASADPILTALAQMEERLATRLSEAFREEIRDLRLDMNGSFDVVHQRLDRLEQEYEMLKAGLARVEADVGTLKSDVAILKTAVERLEGEIILLRAAIQRLETRMEREESDRRDLREQIVEMRRRLGDLDDRVQAIEARLPSD